MEIWKTITEYPDYEISSIGRVKSKQRNVFTTAGRYNIKKLKTVNERILKQSERNGYLFVTLRKNNSHKCNMIHNLVAAEFIGLKKEGLVVNHINSIKSDNNYDNLEYCTMSKNTSHYFKSIGKRKGHININHISRIIQRIESGEKIINIANEYEVGRNDIAVIYKIITLTNEELNIQL